MNESYQKYENFVTLAFESIKVCVRIRKFILKSRLHVMQVFKSVLPIFNLYSDEIRSGNSRLE